MREQRRNLVPIQATHRPMPPVAQRPAQPQYQQPSGDAEAFGPQAAPLRPTVERHFVALSQSDFANALMAAHARLGSWPALAIEIRMKTGRLCDEKTLYRWRIGKGPTSKTMEELHPFLMEIAGR